MIDVQQYRATQARKMSEATLLAQVRALARALGWLGYHTHRSDRSEPGWPDLVLVRGDRLLYRELKTSTGRLMPAQQTWLDALRAAGADASVWRPEDLLEGRVEAELARPRGHLARQVLAGAGR